MSVKCENVETGCEWKGTVGTLADHLKTCGFTMLPCSKECKDEDGKVNCFMRKDLDQHLAEDCPNRDYECQYCEEKGTYATIQVHDKTCEKKILPCTNDDCSKGMERQQLYHHVQFECEFTVVKCKYSNIGCNVELKRKDVEAHEQDDTLHLHMAIDQVTLLNDKCKVLSYMLGKGSMTFKLTEFQKKKENNIVFHSPSFYTGPSGYHVMVAVYANGNGDGKGNYLSVFVWFLEGTYNAELKWPFIGKVTLTLLNQEEDNNHHEMTLNILNTTNIKAGIANNNWGYPKFISHSDLTSKPYLRDDTLYFKVSVEVDGHKPWLEYKEQ